MHTRLSIQPAVECKKCVESGFHAATFAFYLRFSLHLEGKKTDPDLKEYCLHQIGQFIFFRYSYISC